MAREVFEMYDCEVVAETDKAIKVAWPDWGEDFWVPKSDKVISDDSEIWDASLDGSGPGTLVVSLWWAEKNDLA